MNDNFFALEVQIGSRQDYQQIKEWDEFWGDRRQELQGGELFTARNGTECIGYVKIVPSGFLHYPFISILCTKPTARKRGVASTLIKHVHYVWRGSKIFTTTEEDNPDMRSLLKTIGYREVGYVSNVNATEVRELIYCVDA